MGLTQQMLFRLISSLNNIQQKVVTDNNGVLAHRAAEHEALDGFGDAVLVVAAHDLVG